MCVGIKKEVWSVVLAAWGCPCLKDILGCVSKSAPAWAVPRARSAAAGGRGCSRGLDPPAASWPPQAGGKEQSRHRPPGSNPGTELGVDLERVLLREEVAGLPAGHLHSQGPLLCPSCPGLKPPWLGGPLRGGDRRVEPGVSAEPRLGLFVFVLSHRSIVWGRQLSWGKYFTSQGWMLPSFCALV